MKKTKLLALSTLLVAGITASGNADAQVIWSENFNATVSPALPAGWAQGVAVSGASGWVSGLFSSLSSWGTATGTTLPSHPTQVVFVNDWGAGTTTPIGSNTADTLKSPVFSLAGTTAPYLNFGAYFYKAVLTSTGTAEKAYVLGSNNGGATWTVIDSVTETGWGGVWNTQHVNLSSLGTGTNNKVAFRYTDGGGQLLGCVLDDISVQNLTMLDAALTTVNYNDKANGISTNGELVSFKVENRGVPMTSVTAYYRINGGTPIVQTFPVSMGYYVSQNLTFSVPISGSITGASNTIRVGILAVNGAPNTEPVDTAQSSSFSGASAAVQRNGLIEKFCSSTNPPGATFSAIFDPLALSLHADSVGGTFNLISYQMNWPSPGNDRSYNPDGNTRKSYYGVTGIPDHYVNGVFSNVYSSVADLTAEINGASANKAFMDITSTYSVDTAAHKLHVVTQVTPHFTKTGTYHVYNALLDKHYQNTTNTTGQLNYYHIMRKMLPSATGHVVTSWVDGVTQTFIDSNVTYTNGNWTLGSSSYPLAGSYTFWANPLLNSELVAFVEEDGSKSVMQSEVTAPIPACTVPVAATISGAGSVCQGATLTLTPSIGGGSWTSSTPTVATVAGGVVTGVGGGTATITYNLVSSCGSAASTAVVTVNPLPAAGTLTGASGVCVGGTITLTPSVPGGTWSSTVPAVASVSSGGVVVGVAIGVADIVYTVTNSCGSSTAVQGVVVSSAPPPPVSITGSSTVCAGSTLTLSPSAAGGSWTSSAAGVATVSGGVVSGVAGGTVNITYTLDNGCGISTATQAVTVNPLPDAGAITAPDTICVGGTLTVSNTASGGSWSSIGGHATINAGGVVTGTSVGIETISYSVTNSCGTAHATKSVYVKVCVMDGVAQIAANANIQLHPNPTHDVINITSSATIGSVVVTNMVGQKVHEANFKTNTASFNMSSLPDGVYFIKVNNGKVFKVVKQ